MRVRSTTTGGFSSPVYGYDHYKDDCNLTWNERGPYLYGYTGTQKVKVIEDVQTPGFRSLLKCGGFLPLNTVRITTTETSNFPVQWKWWWWSTFCSPQQAVREDWGNWAWSPTFQIPAPTPEAAVETAIVNSAVARSRNASWDALTFLAEASKTHAYISGRLLDLSDFANKVADETNKVARDRRKAMYYLKRNMPPKSSPIYLGSKIIIFSKLWLEARFAIRPLYYDVKDAYAALKKQYQKMGVGRASAKTSGFETRSSSTLMFNNCILVGFEESLTWSQNVRGWAASEFKTRAAAGLDPVVTAYEIIPFSWLLDYFVQVGTWIEATSPFADGATLGSSVSVRTSLEREMHVAGTPNQIWPGITTFCDMPSQMAGKQIVESYYRFAKDPSFPGWNPRINFSRGLDIAALVAGFNTRLLRKLRI